MITEIQNFENAARIATADALLLDGESAPASPALLRWFTTKCIAFFMVWRGVAGLKVG